MEITYIVTDAVSNARISSDADVMALKNEKECFVYTCSAINFPPYFADKRII